MKFKGKVQVYERDEKGEFTKFVRESPNLWVDDSKELTLDFLWGLLSWWNPQTSYAIGEGLWDQDRYLGLGECMFANASFERASGILGIATGDEYNYQVAETYLVSPEDSYLSAEIGTRTVVDITRRDQTVEIRDTILVPEDIAAGLEIREFASFLKGTVGTPTHDPSLHDGSKPYTMLCRSALFGTGYYTPDGLPSLPTASGAELCYFDDPYVTADDIQLLWIFGEM